MQGAKGAEIEQPLNHVEYPGRPGRPGLDIGLATRGPSSGLAAASASSAALLGVLLGLVVLVVSAAVQVVIMSLRPGPIMRPARGRGRRFKVDAGTLQL